ncbi:hypothetical protein FHS14_002632 [Paenibacillus baekrokdamisoli]|nr:hypothetical protein [Paenibacillus baekrokdamisoli]
MIRIFVGQGWRKQEMDPMTKMWVSLVGIGLMAIAALIISLARYKTKGILRFILSILAFGMLVLGGILGFISIT